MSERILITGGSGFIGSHLLSELEARSYLFINVDIKAPSDPNQKRYWLNCDIKKRDSLAAIFREFRPTVVVHLAAKANLNGRTIEDFPDNTIGTRSIVACVNETDSMELLVSTSTQYVVRPGVLPPYSTYLQPYTAYGESKALAECIVRSDCRCAWAILRPTNIWGPGHPFFPHELWRYLERRYYVHPGFNPIRKYYGYVGNAVQQILRIALSDNHDNVCGKVWYITDEAIDNADWMNGFSMELSGKKVRRVPLLLWRAMAMVGDAFRCAGVRSPINSERLFRLTVNEVIPAEMIVDLPPKDRISLQVGIARSVEWFRGMQGGRADGGI